MRSLGTGGGLPTPYLAAGGVAVLAILGIGLAGAKPDDASPAPSATSKSSGGGGSSSSSQSKSSSSGMQLVLQQFNPEIWEASYRTKLAEVIGSPVPGTSCSLVSTRSCLAGSVFAVESGQQ